MNNLKCSVCGCITDLLTPPSFCDRHHCNLLLVRYNLVFHLINIEVVFSCLKFGIKCLSNFLIVRAAGEEVFSMGTVWADTALFGQRVLSISARLYSQSMVANSVPRHLLFSFTIFHCTQIFCSCVISI